MAPLGACGSGTRTFNVRLDSRHFAGSLDRHNGQLHLRSLGLGNTGSKTTIHKYLKELEQEEGSGPRKAAITDALQDLVECLAARLHQEARHAIRAREELLRKERELVKVNQQLRDDLAAAYEAMKTVELRLNEH